MKISIFTKYGALNSTPIFNCITRGLSKLNHDIVYNSYDADLYIIWSLLFHGRMEPNKFVLEHAASTDKPIIVIEVSSLNRNTLWRIGINGLNLPNKTFQPNRHHHIGMALKPWNTTGEHILICGQRTNSHLWKHGNVNNWLINMIESVREYTDRPIIFRPHPREPYFKDLSNYNVSVQQPVKIPSTYDDYDFSLENAWIVINSSSSPAIQAVINGIPVITDAHNIAYPMSTPLAEIEQPCYHNREEWFDLVCHMEWFSYELEDPTILSNILSDVLQS